MSFTHCSLPVQRALRFEKTCFLRTNTDTNQKKKQHERAIRNYDELGMSMTNTRFFSGLLDVTLTDTLPPPFLPTKQQVDGVVYTFVTGFSQTYFLNFS